MRKSIDRRRLIAGAGAALGAGLLPVWAQAQAAWKPNAPVKLLNGFSAGGSADVLCRILAESLRPILGQPVIVDTRAGANGFIAAEAVTRAAPDGLTIGLATMGMLTISPQLPGVKLPINVQTELTPISSIAGIYMLMVSAPNAPFRTLPELIAYAKAHPGEVSYASAGNGSTPHLCGELFKRQAGIDIVHIPYKGGAQALVDIEAGRVHILIGNMPDYLSHVKGGQLRAIAFGGEQASPALPDVPLIKQWLPGFSVSNWFGIIGPPGMPPNIVAGLNAAFQTAMAEPGARKRMMDLGAEIVGGSPAQFQQMISSGYQRWGDVIRAAQIKAE